MVATKTLSALALAAILDVTYGTAAPNFPIPGGPADLTVAFGSNTVSPPGELIPRADTANPPTLSLTSAPTSRTLLLMVDTDVPRNNTRVQLLHWLTANIPANSTRLTPPAESAALAPYRQPSPPAGDIAHAYTLLLFAQPANFSVPKQFLDVLQSRVPFDVKAFVTAAGLGTPLASNYFKVQEANGTATATSSARASGSATATSSVRASGSGTATSSRAPTSSATNGTKPVTFNGGAVRLGEMGWMVGVGVTVLGLAVGLVL